jgi:hypothetical protein
VSGNGGSYLGASHVIETLRTFLDLTGAITVPSLEEYQILPDKVIWAWAPGPDGNLELFLELIRVHSTLVM